MHRRLRRTFNTHGQLAFSSLLDRLGSRGKSVVIGVAKLGNLSCLVMSEERSGTVSELGAFGMGRSIMIVVVVKEKVADSGSARMCILVLPRTLEATVVADSGEHDTQGMCKL